jgi:hypothetical protein
MKKDTKILILNLPSPPFQEINRDWAGGFGTAIHSKRTDYGQDRETTLHPFLPYASAVLKEAEYEFSVLDCQRLKLNQHEILSTLKKRNPDILFSMINLPSHARSSQLVDFMGQNQK